MHKFIDDKLITNTCSGFKNCKDRTYDENDPECRPCEDDAWNALDELMKDC